VAGHNGVNLKMKEWGFRDMDKCPRCGEVEDAPYVWECQAPEAKLVKSEGLFKVRKWMADVDMNDEISRVLMA
jgi:hypothetical protein